MSSAPPQNNNAEQANLPAGQPMPPQQPLDASSMPSNPALPVHQQQQPAAAQAPMAPQQVEQALGEEGGVTFSQQATQEYQDFDDGDDDDDGGDGGSSAQTSQGGKGGQNRPVKRAGRRKINIEFIKDKSRRHITFSKRKAGIMKKAYELSTLTGTQVLLLVASETGHVYTFATPKLQPLITKTEGKNLIQACLNAPDPSPDQHSMQPPSGGVSMGNMGHPQGMGDDGMMSNGYQGQSALGHHPHDPIEDERKAKRIKTELKTTSYQPPTPTSHYGGMSGGNTPQGMGGPSMGGHPYGGHDGMGQGNFPNASPSPLPFGQGNTPNFMANLNIAGMQGMGGSGGMPQQIRGAPAGMGGAYTSGSGPMPGQMMGAGGAPSHYNAGNQQLSGSPQSMNALYQLQSSGGQMPQQGMGQKLNIQQPSPMGTHPQHMMQQGGQPYGNQGGYGGQH